MATLTRTILENPAQPVSTRYEHILAGTSPSPRASASPRGTELRLSTPTGDNLPCQRHNGPWYNFILPAGTSHLWLDMTALTEAGRTVAELIFFMGEREQSLAVPASIEPQQTENSPTAMLQIEVPPFPHWVQGLLCVRLAQADHDYADQAA